MLLTSAVVGGDKLHAFAALPGMHRTGGWVDTRTGLYDVESLELLLFGLQVCIQSLYRLLYPCLLHASVHWWYSRHRIESHCSRENNWPRQCFIVKIITFRLNHYSPTQWYGLVLTKMSLILYFFIEVNITSALVFMLLLMIVNYFTHIFLHMRK
jgi:hypothetical protein